MAEVKPSSDPSSVGGPDGAAIDACVSLLNELRAEIEATPEFLHEE